MSSAGDRLMAAIAVAAPALVRDVRPLIADYAAARMVDWDFDGCRIDKEGRCFELVTADVKRAAGQADAYTIPTPATMSPDWAHCDGLVAVRGSDRRQM